MVLHFDKPKEVPHVKFVDYTGKYPRLCDGVLTLEIDGVLYTFGPKPRDSKITPDFPQFWKTGGHCYRQPHGYDIIHNGEWIINADALPEQFKQYADEIDIVMNNHISWGCCGGCV